jgi:transcription antitermination factor NusG
MKVVFSNPVPKRNKVDIQFQREAEQKEYITGFQNGEVLSNNKKVNKPIVIPLEDSSFAKYVEIMEDSDDEENKIQKPDDFAIAGYGLIKMKKSEDSSQNPTPNETPQDKNSIPPLLRNRPAILGAITDELDRFRKDVELRPPETGPESYSRISIDKFGEALMRGMGWAPGVPIGKNATECTKVYEIKKRPANLGIGATPKPEFYVGVKIRLTGGEFRGKKAQVLKLEKTEATVILEFNNKQATVQVRHMKKLRKQEEDFIPLPTKKRKAEDDEEDKKRKRTDEKK